MTAGPARAVSTYCVDLSAEIERLTGFAPRIEWSDDARQFGAWIPVDVENGDEDLIGSGDSEDEALADALDTVRGWESSSVAEAIAAIGVRFARCLAGVS